MFNTLFFPVMFLLLATLLIWIIIGCKGWWAAKFWLINISVMFTFIIWFSLSSYLGYPSDQELPNQFRLISYFSNEPICLYVLADKHGEESFTIKGFFRYKSQDTLRLYKTPYDREFHKALENAMERVNKGNYVVASKKKILDAEELKRYGKILEESDGDNSMDGTRSPNDNYRMYVFPPSKFIKKPEN